MEKVTLQQMKGALGKVAGSRFPVKLTLMNGEVVVRYIRGFADQQTQIVLISETSYSLSMKILELKEIAVLEYADGDPDKGWIKLHAKWNKKPKNEP